MTKTDAIRLRQRSTAGAVKRGVLWGVAVAAAVVLLLLVGYDIIAHIPPRGARVVRAEAEASNLAKAVKHFQRDHGRWPTDLQELVRPPDNAEPMLDRLLRDPWGGEYVLQIENDTPRVYSAGPDGVFGTSDDIENRRDK